MGSFVGGAEARERIGAALDAIDAAHDVLRDTSSDLVGSSFRVEVAERLETQERTNRGLMYRIFGEIADPPDETGFVPAVRDKLWARLRITPGEITRRFKLAARIRPRRSLTGPPLPAQLPELAAAVQAGDVGEDHIRAVCRAVDVLPASVSPPDVANAERRLVEHAGKVDAKVVEQLGQRIADYLNPDGCSPTRTAPGAAGCTWAHRGPMTCLGSADGSTPRPARTSKRSRPPYGPAATNPTMPSVTTARPPSAATTHSSWAWKPRSPPVGWVCTEATP